MSEQLTDWFDGNVKPVRIGVYQRDIGEFGTAYWHFDGRRWNFGGHGRDPSEVGKNGSATVQTLRWRGLAQPHGKELG